MEFSACGSECRSNRYQAPHNSFRENRRQGLRHWNQGGPRPVEWESGRCARSGFRNPEVTRQVYRLSGPSNPVPQTDVDEFNGLAERGPAAGNVYQIGPAESSTVCSISVPPAMLVQTLPGRHQNI